MAAAIAMAAKLHNICNSPSSTRRRSDAAGIAVSGVCFIFPATLSNRSLMVLASKSQKDETNSSIKDRDPPAFTSQEDDLKYLLKLGGGSILGAAAIKYGSILFPDITRPNILQALFMISAPVILSVIFLVKKSRVH